MSDCLATIPQAQLRMIIPNGWEDALRTAWRLEPRSRVRDPDEPERGNPVNIAKGKAMRRAILVVLQEFRTVSEVANALGENTARVRHHMHKLAASGQLRTVVSGEVTLWIAKVAA